MEKSEKNILLYIADMLLEDGLITEKERDKMKAMVHCEDTIWN